MNSAAIYRMEAEIGLPPLYNGPRISGVMYFLSLKPVIKLKYECRPNDKILMLFYYTEAGDKDANNDENCHGNLLLPHWIS